MSLDESKNLRMNIPGEAATKQLLLQDCSAGKKLVISTNFLELLGFPKGTNTKEALIGKNRGIRITIADPDQKKKKLVYERTYKRRKNNPTETMIDIRRQELLNDAFPEGTERVHVTITYGEIIIVPITERKSKAIKQFKKSQEKESFVACSSGVDAVSMVKKGFKIETLLEYRPNEKRDKNDLTETGAINALVNVPINYLINEDIMNLDLDRLAKLCAKSNYTNATFSIQCDDFSNVKANSLKEKSIADGSTTLDMVIDAINIVAKFCFPTVFVENVPNFFTSDAGKILMARLKRLGYDVYWNKFNALDYGGYTNRTRGYMFATMLPAEFKMPEPKERNMTSIWEKFIAPRLERGEFRDVTDCNSTKDGVKTGRARLITKESLFSPTILKSQNRQAKDSVFIYDDETERYFFPNNELLAELMGIEMDFSGVAQGIESEIIGQSVEVPLHEELLDAINQHIDESRMILTGRLL